MIEITEYLDISRRSTHSTSSNICFPHLHPNGEMSQTDFGEYKIGKYLLKKQSIYAHQMANGLYQWNYAHDSIHMMHTYARLLEMSVHANVSCHLSQHPDAAHAPLKSVLNALKEATNDEGIIDSKHNLAGIMAQIPNRSTREYWLSKGRS